MMFAKTLERQKSLPLEAFGQMLKSYGPRDFAVRFWDGTVWCAETSTPRFTLVLYSSAALERLMNSRVSDLSLGEQFVNGEFDVEGDLESATRLAEHLFAWCDLRAAEGKACRRLTGGHCRRANGETARRAALGGKRHSLARDRRAIAYHYNVSNEFYRLWLDDSMVYSCGRFSKPSEDLNSAQQRRMASLCRKLKLKANQRLVDIGCGWGGLMLYAAQRCGTHCLGITLSQPQADFANRRFKSAHVADRCRASVRDYRELNCSTPFDKAVSVGMLEHVGDSQLGEYFRRVFQLLRPGGTFLASGIADSLACHAHTRPSFVTRYVFPDGEIVPIHILLRRAEEAGFEVRSVENLRWDYAKTLRHWVARLEGCRDRALQVVDAGTYRAWRLYMAASARRFAIGQLCVFETVLTRPCES